MKKFMAIFTGNPADFEKWQKSHSNPGQKEAAEKAGMEAWMQWGQTHHKAVVDHGGPLGKTKRVTKDGVKDIKNQMAGYTILQAESHEAAAKLFLGHPHFMIFPGDGVEIMECLPIPDMPQ
jgi:hypothetical protein